jgi:hypothetical protein
LSGLVFDRVCGKRAIEKIFVFLYHYIFVMKKIEATIALFALLSAGFVSCIGEKDFDTDRISLNELHPTFLLPLIEDSLTLNQQPNISYESDTSDIFYNIDDIRLAPDAGWFSIPDVEVNLPLKYSYAPGNTAVDVTLPPVSFPLLTNSGQELDSLLCSGLPVKIAFSGLPSLELLEVTFPQILVNGQPYTKNITAVTTEIVLPACKIVPKDKRALEILVHIKGQIQAPINANLNVQIKNILSYHPTLFGYFGKTIVNVEESIELNIMDELNITATSLEFDILKIVANIQNSMGIPFRLTVKEIKAYDKDGQLLKTESSNESIDILALGYADINRTAVTKKTIRRERFGQILSEKTRKVVFSFTCVSNPDGVGRNFLTAESALIPAISMRIPLVVKAQGLVLQDTIGVNISSVSLEELKLQMRLKNSIPATATLHVWLLDENNTPYSTPLIDNLTIEQPTIDNGMAVDEKSLQQTIAISRALFNQLKKSTQALATIGINTGPGYVVFKKDNHLYMKIGAEVKFRYEELLK